MPIHMGAKTYSKFATAVAAVKRRKGKRKIRNPAAYVAAIERKEKGHKEKGHKGKDKD